MEKEKLEILSMVKDGTITPEDALKLLDAISQEHVKFVFAENGKGGKKNLLDQVMDLADTLGVKPKKGKPANVEIITEGNTSAKVVDIINGGEVIIRDTDGKEKRFDF